MKLAKFILCLLLSLVAVARVAAADQPSRTAKPIAARSASANPILPHQFGGWNLSGTIRTSKDPAVADPANSALFKEYGFNDFESATYVSDDGRKLTVKAARFADATGAYGAFTYYKMPQM